LFDDKAVEVSLNLARFVLELKRLRFGLFLALHRPRGALGPADGPDVRGMPDGMLLHLRDTYPVETA